MTQREKKLVGLLFGTALLAACVLAAASGMDRLREASTSIDRYRTQLARIEARASENPAALEARIGELKAAVTKLEEFAKGTGKDTDLAGFGAAVRGRLKAAGAAVLRYQPAQVAAQGKGAEGGPEAKERPSNLLEFAARGSPLALSRFLLAAARADWKIPFLSVRSESASAPVEFVLRIRHDY